jgi:hypothetical protein
MPGAKDENGKKEVMLMKTPELKDELMSWKAKWVGTVVILSVGAAVLLCVSAVLVVVLMVGLHWAKSAAQ